MTSQLKFYITSKMGNWWVLARTRPADIIAGFTVPYFYSSYDYLLFPQIHMPKGLMPCQAYDKYRLNC